LNILLLRHYPLFEGISMRSFAEQIATGMRSRGHMVVELTAPIFFSRLAPPRGFAKWLGYIDMFLLFPPLFWWRIFRLKRTALYVVADQALGPWIPLLTSYPHVVHVHDLLALESALGLQPFHQLRFLGRLYQLWIREGFRSASVFLSISTFTQASLERQLHQKPLLSQVLPNALAERFRIVAEADSSKQVAHVHQCLASEPFLFHIGRNWYKNRLGLLRIWSYYCHSYEPIHLVLVGSLDQVLARWLKTSPYSSDYLHVLDCASDDLVVALYNKAAALLFPSHAEGFGWPILEALACGCRVITTDKPPMSEVGGDAATYIQPYPADANKQNVWVHDSALKLHELLSQDAPTKQEQIERGLEWVTQFYFEAWLDRLENFYCQALGMQLVS
jgi:glycosyltransferase involved in cell wall biosynthesis